MDDLFSISFSDSLTPLWLTLKVAVVATVVASILAIGCACYIARTRFRGKELLDTLFVLPMVLPPTVMGYYLIIVLGRNGFLGRWFEQVLGIRFMFTLNGAIIASIIVAFPLIYKSARAAFEEIPEAYVEAAQNLGASSWTVFWRITLPLAIRGIMAGVMLALARTLGEFGATLMIAGNLPGKTQTLSIAIYQAVQDGRDAQAWLLTAIVCVLCITILLSVGSMLRKRVAPANI